MPIVPIGHDAPTHRFDYPIADRSVGVLLTCLDSLSKLTRVITTPTTTAASDGEQTQLPLARHAPQELQHRRQVVARHPRGLGHGLLLPQHQIDDPAPACVVA